MEVERFEAMVSRLEALSKKHPRLYRLRVLLVACLGYAYLFAMLLLVLLAGAGILLMLATGKGLVLFAKLGWPVALLAFVIARSLWIRFDPPTGARLVREDAPDLFDRIEEIRKAVAAPRPSVVLAQPDLNAAVVQVPRLGVLGWQKNYLLLGLPLMRALSPREFEAVVAHEFGHLAGAHGRFSGWIYRQRMSWALLLGRLEAEQRWGTFLFRRFAAWYAPFFNATSFVLARLQEYEADLESAAVRGPRNAADALLRVEIAAARLDGEFWPAVQASARRTEEPPHRIFAALGAGLETGDPRQWRAATGAPPAAHDAPVDDREIVATALERVTTSDDTHPCLLDRLAALGQPDRVPPPFEESAARHYLGPCADRLEQGFSEQWRASVAGSWQAAHEQGVAERSRIDTLSAQRTVGDLAADESWSLACLLGNEDRTDEAFEVVGSLVESEPDFAPALRSWGIHLLEQGREEGLAHIDRALSLSRDGYFDACRAAHAFLGQRDREQEAERYVDLAREHSAWLSRGRAERESIVARDPVEPHGLEDAQLDGLRDQLARQSDIRRAYLVRKKVEVAPDSPVYLLAVELTRPFARTSRGRARISNMLSETLVVSDDWFCLVGEATNRSWRRRIRTTSGGPFYVRSA